MVNLGCSFLRSFYISWICNCMNCFLVDWSVCWLVTKSLLSFWKYYPAQIKSSHKRIKNSAIYFQILIGKTFEYILVPTIACTYTDCYGLIQQDHLFVCDLFLNFFFYISEKFAFFVIKPKKFKTMRCSWLQIEILVLQWNLQWIVKSILLKPWRNMISKFTEYLEMNKTFKN